MSNDKEVATKKKNEVATIDIEKFADQGFENIDSKSLQLPFLKILGQLSPQVTAGDSKYIEAAKPGMIYNTVTDKLYDGNKGILVIPAYYKFEYIEWADRGQEGSSAPRNIYPADSDVMSKTNRGDDGKDRLESGNYIEETASHFVVVVEDHMASEALITMKSTQRKKSKKWNSMMNMMQVPKKDGKGFFRPAPFTQQYRLKTVLEKNQLGSWYGWEITSEGLVNDESLVNRAYKFRQSLATGSVKVKHGQEEESAKTPF
jgi:hypothetical protein